MFLIKKIAFLSQALDWQDFPSNSFCFAVPSLGLTRGPKHKFLISCPKLGATRKQKHKFFFPIPSLGLTRGPKYRFLLSRPKLGTDERSQSQIFAIPSQALDWQEVPSTKFGFPVPSLGLTWIPITTYCLAVPSLWLTRGRKHKFLLSHHKLGTEKRSQAQIFAFLSQAWDLQKVPSTNSCYPVQGLGLTRGPKPKFLLSRPKLRTDKRSQA